MPVPTSCPNVLERSDSVELATVLKEWRCRCRVLVRRDRAPDQKGRKKGVTLFPCTKCSDPEHVPARQLPKTIPIRFGRFLVFEERRFPVFLVFHKFFHLLPAIVPKNIVLKVKLKVKQEITQLLLLPTGRFQTFLILYCQSNYYCCRLSL